MDPSRPYRLHRGFRYRRESFGGILYHYEGVRPDPRVYFLDSPFLIDLLELVESHLETPLGGLTGAVRERFALSPAQFRAMEDFLATLAGRGALVPQ